MTPASTTTRRRPLRGRRQNSGAPLQAEALAMHAVQLVLADPVYAAGLRDALTRSGPWSIDSPDVPDLSQPCVLVLDEGALTRAPRPLLHPERVVLITRTDPQHLAQAWEAGIVSVVSSQDPPSTVLLAIMAACLRVPRQKSTAAGEDVACAPASGAPNAPTSFVLGSKPPKH